MTTLHVAVGSQRRPKLNAVKEAALAIATLMGDGVVLEVVGYEVESGVSHTPTSREELMQGARQRADALQEILRSRGTTASFYISVEGGLDGVTENRVQWVFLQS
jgi:non-canonical (house-cleaning) NTP pyrophosphatase